jgi:hypothetical protein
MIYALVGSEAPEADRQVVQDAIGLWNASVLDDYAHRGVVRHALDASLELQLDHGLDYLAIALRLSKVATATSGTPVRGARIGQRRLHGGTRPTLAAHRLGTT